MHSVVRQAVLVAFQLFCLQGQSDSCAADGTCAETLHRRSFDEPLQKPHREPKEVLRDTKRFGRSGRSILEQEVLELEALSELYQKQLALLEDLQRGLHAGLGRHLPKASVHALLEGVPPLSEQVIGGAPPGRLHAEEEDDAEFGETKSLGGATSTAAAPNDFVVSKAVVPQESAATLLGLLPLRNHRSTAPTPTSQIAMPTVLVVAVQEDRDICLFTVSGDLLYTFSSGHKQAVAQLAISPMQDEYMVATADLGGVMRVHRLNVRPRRNPQEQRWRVTNPEEEKVSNHLGSPANITAQFHLATRIPLAVDNISNSSPTLTAFVMTAVQGVKYFLTGDSVGWISVLTRNGTLHERFRVGSEPVKRINAHLGNVVYVSGNQWGLLDLEKGTARAFSCYKYQGPGLLDAVTDTASQSRVLAADVEGTIWVFSVREKRDCKVEHRFPVGTTRAPLSLSSIRGFLLAVEKSRHSRSEVTVLNMTHVGKGWDDPARDVSPISWKRSSRPLRDWAVQRRYQEGDLLVTLSEDGMEIEVFELMMQVYQPPPSDMLGNFKLPIFAAAMVMVMGYQFVKQKSPFETGEEPGGA